VASKAELKRLYKTFFDGFYGLLKWQAPLTAFGRGQQVRTRLIEFMGAVIQQRRAEPIDPMQDFLAMMLANQNANPTGMFSDALIENQCLLQLWASHYEGTGLLASWMYLLGQHPILLERVQSELADMLSSFSHLEQVGMNQLKQMTWVDATIKETLRILPPTSTLSPLAGVSTPVWGHSWQWP
jgi:cytochrome P450